MRHRRHRRHHRHSAGFGRHLHLRHNPVGDAVASRGDRVKRALLGAVIVGGIATVTVVGLDAAIAALVPATWTNTMKNGLKIAVGLGAAAGLGAISGIPTSIVSGVAIGAVADGLLGFYNTYLASSVAAAISPSTVAAAVPALAGGGPPSGQAAGTFTSSVGVVWTSVAGGVAAVPAGMQYVTDPATSLTWYTAAGANPARQALPSGMPAGYVPYRAPARMVR